MRIPLSVPIAVLLCVLSASSLVAQTLPPHPRLLFTADQLPVLQQRVSDGAAPVQQAYARLYGTASIPGYATWSGLGSWAQMRELRRMQEAAFKYALTGNGSNFNAARNALLGACQAINPTGSDSYKGGSYVAAIAITFDLLHGGLSAADRATVVARLQQWISALRSGSAGAGSYLSYQGCSENHAFGWDTGIAMAALAILGEETDPNVESYLLNSLARIHDGWRDNVSPDGSVDEHYGYANYGPMYAAYAAHAAILCGYQDIVAGSNFPLVGSWFSASLFEGAFPWVGDSSPSHKGLRIDPIVYYAIKRRHLAALAAGDAAEAQRAGEDLYGVERIFAVEPVADGANTFAFSAWISIILHHPSTPLLEDPQAPGIVAAPAALRSAFFRDNLNQGYSAENKVRNYPEVGTGGQAFLHNLGHAQAGVPFSLLYQIRDEWMNHSHEDDGNLILALNGVQMWMDQGYGGSGAAQDLDHNIVMRAGSGGFMGSGTNYFTPPYDQARFFGKREASLFSGGADYVRGSHETMWMLQRARRTVLMIKDASAPYLILLDDVDNGANTTFEELFHAAGPFSGSGTLASPATISSQGQVLRSVWLSPANVNIVPGGASSNSSQTWYRNKVTATGSEVAFLSVHGPQAPGGILPLDAPQAGTRGGTLLYSTHSDKLLAGDDAGAADAETLCDGRLVWIRSEGGQFSSYLMAEGSSLRHAGELWLTSDRVVTASVFGGEVRISTEAGTGEVVASILVPGAVSSVQVDGQEVNYTQSGQMVLIGGGFQALALSTDDRTYSFAGGSFSDLLVSGNALVIGERATSSGNWAQYRLRGGDLFEPRQLALGFTVAIPGAMPGSQMGIAFETAAWSNDTMGLMLGVSGSGGFYFRQDRPGQVGVAEIQIPEGSVALMARIHVELDFPQGVLTVRDACGTQLGTMPLPAVSQPLGIRYFVTEHAFLDDLTVFDCQEDGVHAQGVAFWGAADGRAGFAVHAHQGLAGYENFLLSLGGHAVDGPLTALWMQLGLMHERGLVFAPVTGGVPPQLRDLVFESAGSAYDPTVPMGLHATGATVQDLGSLLRSY